MGLLRDWRDREPRLKPGVTYTRLAIFLVGVAVFGVLGEHFASGSDPETSSDCGAKEITTEARKEGSCFYDNTKIVVVDEHSALKLDSLEARLEGIREREKHVTFDLAITNRTDEPATVTEDQFVLLLGSKLYGEDSAADERNEPRSFRAREHEIPPRGTENGTVTFTVPGPEIKTLREGGNLDLGNFVGTGGADEPEAIFDAPEYGVIRTYQ